MKIHNLENEFWEKYPVVSPLKGRILFKYNGDKCYFIYDNGESLIKESGYKENDLYKNVIVRILKLLEYACEKI